MVAGKSNPQALARLPPTTRLPPLPALRVRRPNAADQNPCLGVMTSVLGCWASQGQAAQGCAVLEQQLRACMDAKRPAQKQKNNINYHLSRFYPQIIGPHKRKK